MDFLKSKKIFLFVSILWSLLCTPAQANEKPLVLYEQKIKAGLVYNLLKYTTWPKAMHNGKLHICLLGGDPFDGYLSPLEGRTAQQTVISIHHVDEIEKTEKCHLVVIHNTQSNNLPALLEFLHAKSILTISDMKGFALQGGMIEMAKENEKISLYINKEATTQAGLTIEDPMLKLAKIVATHGGA